MSKLIDLTGQRFGHLVVIKRAENSKCRQARWLCQCDCGQSTIVVGCQLRNGQIKSCGCLRREKLIQRSLRHGETHHRIYNIWLGIKRRCLKPGDSGYEKYGGRGITVCEEWRNSYVAFRDWAMANGYAEDLTIDRIDNNGPYSPENCRWTTNAEQAKNRRSTRLIEYNGKTLCIKDWARETGINYCTLFRRLSHGWSIERALTTPVQNR